MSDTTWPHVLNLSNSIIGVTVLAMPFCFMQCGILLGMTLLFFSTWLTLTSCQLLMKAGIISRRRSYGFLAYYTHGAPGKFAVEVGMIGLQIGTLIAQVVIIGDLGPAIISKVTGIQNSSHLRTGLIILLCSCVGLPLGLLKNLTTVSRASSLCMAFYTLFVLYVMYLSVPNLLKGDWYNKVNLWRTEGLFKCLPIFSFAFGCQTQLFILYDALPEPSLKTMNSIVGSAVNMCTVAYLLVGFFGYVAFCDIDITGDIITHFAITLTSDILKLGFVISIAITFPLIIFPCRNSLYTLLFPHKPKHDENIEPQRPVIPELHFKIITVCIVVGAMITGILVPNVEFVLAMNGATMGTLICYIFPAMFFLRVMTSSSDGKSLAQLVFIFGFTILLLCTYTTLMSQDVGHVQPVADIMDRSNNVKDNKPVMAASKPPNIEKSKDLLSKDKEPPDRGGIVKDDKRIEPPNPREPAEPDKINKSDLKKALDNSVTEKSIKLDKPASEAGPKLVDDKDIKKDVDQKKEGEKEAIDQKQKDLLKQLENQQKESKKLLDEQKKILEELKHHKEDVHKKEEEVVEKQQKQDVQQPVNEPKIQQLAKEGQGQQILNANQNQQVLNPGQGQNVLNLGQGQQVINQGQGQQVLNLGQGQQVNPGQGQQQVGQQLQQQDGGVNQFVKQVDNANKQYGQQNNQVIGNQNIQGQLDVNAQQNVMNVQGKPAGNIGQEQSLGNLNQGQQQVNIGQGQQQINVGLGQQPINVGQGQQPVNVGQGQQPVNVGQGQQPVQGQLPMNVGQGKQFPNVAEGQQLANAGQEQQQLNIGKEQQPANNVFKGQQDVNVGQGQQLVKQGQGQQVVNAGQGQQIANQGQGVLNAGQGQQLANQGQGQQVFNADQGQQAVNAGKGQQLENINPNQIGNQQKKDVNAEKKNLMEKENVEKDIVNKDDKIEQNDDKKVKNEEMRRKKLSIDDNGQESDLRHEGLDKLNKDVSNSLPRQIFHLRSLASKKA